jgi:prepilin peptidase CpaA
MKVEAAAALVLVSVASITDLRSRRVPNVLTLTAPVLAFAYHGFSYGWPGLVMSLGGWVVGLLLFLPLFALRGIGGGDVKLLAAVGAWLGPMPTVWVALFTALAGGLLAIVVSAYHGYTRQAFTNVWGLLSYWRVMGIRPHPAMMLESSKSPRLPYAVPMAAGLGLALWLK